MYGIQSSFPGTIHKVSNIGISVLLKFENKLDVVNSSHINFISKHPDKCKFAIIKLHKIYLAWSPVPKLFENCILYKNANFDNLVYYGKTRMCSHDAIAITTQIPCIPLVAIIKSAFGIALCE